MNPPRLCFAIRNQRKLGDSNPRYGYPHGSLANCWFQPLTQTSIRLKLTGALFLNCECKGIGFYCNHQMFSVLFYDKMRILLHFCSWVRLVRSFCDVFLLLNALVVAQLVVLCVEHVCQFGEQKVGTEWYFFKISWGLAVTFVYVSVFERLYCLVSAVFCA